jgi:uncharacterized protein (TIGR03435 family)
MRLTLLILVALAAEAQPQPSRRMEFEVVSVKPGDPMDPSSSGRSTPGGLQMRNSTVSNLIRGAYSLNEFQLEGGPKWIHSEKFNIDAKFPPGGSRDQGTLMLQSMLADRFQLEFHRETRTLKQYDLVVAKGGPKLHESDEGDKSRGGSSQGPRQIKGSGQSMSTLAQMLISAVGAPVADRTGLEGKYDFALEFAPLLDTPRENETLPSIFAVLQEKLGLKLEATKGPVEVLVIDRVERPSGN